MCSNFRSWTTRLSFFGFLGALIIGVPIAVTWVVLTPPQQREVDLGVALLIAFGFAVGVGTNGLWIGWIVDMLFSFRRSAQPTPEVPAHSATERAPDVVASLSLPTATEHATSPVKRPEMVTITLQSMVAGVLAAAFWLLVLLLVRQRADWNLGEALSVGFAWSIVYVVLGFPRSVVNRFLHSKPDDILCRDNIAALKRAVILTLMRAIVANIVCALLLSAAFVLI